MAVVINGEARVLKLTLGALAALEARLEERSLVALVERFETGAFRAGDVLALLGAGLAGGGHPMSEDALGQSEIEGGPVRAAQVAAELLARAFTVPGK